MIDLYIVWADLGCRMNRNGDTVEFGDQSVVELFSSQVLYKEARMASTEYEFWVGESADPFPGLAHPNTLHEMYGKTYCSEGIKVEVRLVAGQYVISVARTAVGGCPIYLSFRENACLVVSWRFERAVQNLNNREINIEACARLLESGVCPVREQVVAGVYMLWPGEIAVITKTGIQFDEAFSYNVFAETSLADNGEACRAFVDMLESRLRPVIARARQPLVEFSGGLDSSISTIAASRCKPGISSYGLIQAGTVGEQQRRRRNELVTRFHLDDFEHPADSILPIAALDLIDSTWTPFDDNHRLACVGGYSSHPSGPFDLVVTGVGGDELLMNATFQRSFGEVAGGVSSSAITCAWARADLFLRNGVWPVNPFLSQDVVDFCRSLPRALKSGRMLNLISLAREGLSDGYIFPRYEEHYGNILRHEGTIIDIEFAILDSEICRLGIFEPSKLIDAARREMSTGFTYDTLIRAWYVIKLDRVLRRYSLFD